jgi:hypothetical protein
MGRTSNDQRKFRWEQLEGRAADAHMRQLNDSRSLAGEENRPGLSAIARRAEEEGTDESSPALQCWDRLFPTLTQQ